jgi:hypothetical protein
MFVWRLTANIEIVPLNETKGLAVRVEIISYTSHGEFLLFESYFTSEYFSVIALTILARNRWPPEFLRNDRPIKSLGSIVGMRLGTAGPSDAGVSKLERTKMLVLT